MKLSEPPANLVPLTLEHQLSTRTNHARLVEAVEVNGIVAVVEYFAPWYRLNERY